MFELLIYASLFISVISVTLLTIQLSKHQKRSRADNSLKKADDLLPQHITSIEHNKSDDKLSNSVKDFVYEGPVHKELKDQIGVKLQYQDVDAEKTTIFKKQKSSLIPEEQQSEIKHIGYMPINVFAQNEPLNFPYVLMPPPNNVIKFPKKGRTGRKGFKEDAFKKNLIKHFADYFKIYDDRFITKNGNQKPFEPDFTLVDEKDGINLFLDIEIDEPYEGINDIDKRRPTHYERSDIDRNNAFKNRGWIVIRFAEIQVHQQPDSCCRFVADVIKSIYPKFMLSEKLMSIEHLTLVRQWTYKEAEAWSKDKYRERYLGISSFGNTFVQQSNNNILDTDLDKLIEEEVKDDETELAKSHSKLDNILSNNELIANALDLKSYLSFTYEGTSYITKPIAKDSFTLTAFCFVKNKDLILDLHKITNLSIKNNYYTTQISGPTLSLKDISVAIKMAIEYNKFVRMKYTPRPWSSIDIDAQTGKYIITTKEAERSTRTISNVQLSTVALSLEHINTYRIDENYITAFCNKRDEQRTFKLDRIGEIEVLDL